MIFGSKNTSYRLFEKGDYQGVVEGGKTSSKDHLPWVIGAYSFLGRLNEAEILYTRAKRDLPEEHKVICRFYLAVTSIRHGHRKKGLAYLKENRTKLSGSPSSDFFIHQGLGFLSFFDGHYPESERHASAAYKNALGSGIKYQEFLALDLRGHALIEMAEITEGMATLNQALRVMKVLGDSNHVSLRCSILAKTSYYGLKKGILPELKKTIAGLDVSDTFSKSSLLIEMARQEILMGNLNSAEKALDEATQVTYYTGNHRHKALINFVRANLKLRSGQGFVALALIQALENSTEGLDPALMVRIRGLEQKILNFLNLPPVSASETKKSRRSGEDPMGDLMDLIRSRPEEAVGLCVEKGYLGLLYDCFKIPYGQSVIGLGLKPRSVTIFDGGSAWQIEGLTNLQSKILVHIANGEGSLEELVSSIWKLEYHPLRHDGLVYKALSQLKKVLGEASFCIERDEGRYALAARFKVRSFSKVHDTKEKETIASDTQDLTYRQLMILKWFAKNKDKALDIQMTKKLFQVSTMTAYRDLKLLCDQNQIKALGKARARKYVLL